MTRGTIFLSEEQVLAAVGRLDRARLTRLVQTEVIRPASAGGQVVYRQVDVARLELACDLCDDFDLGEEALGMVLRLVDQLHGARGDLAALMRALAEEAEDVRLRVTQRLER